MQQLIDQTPHWVWGVLLILLFFGGMQMRPRTVSRPQIIILPAAMTLLSLSTVWSAFTLPLLALMAWIFGVVIAQGIHFILPLPRGLMREASGERLHVPGSAVPMMLMMLIFSINYFINASLATRLFSPDQPYFVAIASALLGASSGSFIARSRRMWRKFQDGNS